MTDNRDVTDRAEGGPARVVDVYWRAGCPFCLRLRQALIWARVPVTWHNIWADPDAAAYVRSAALGNETVPTVVVAGRTFVNPSPADLLSMIDQAHPTAPRWPTLLAAWRDFHHHRRR